MCINSSCEFNLTGPISATASAKSSSLFCLIFLYPLHVAAFVQELDLHLQVYKIVILLSPCTVTITDKNNLLLQLKQVVIPLEIG